MNLVEHLDSKTLIKHIANGRLCDLCLLCLIPLEKTSFENIFTLICKDDAEYCVADALEAVCQFEFHRSENYNVCTDCFKSASVAYKFYLQAKRSMEIITHYTQELLNNTNTVEITGEDTEKLLFIPLSEYTPKSKLFDFNLNGVGRMFDDNLPTNVRIANRNDEQHISGGDIKECCIAEDCLTGDKEKIAKYNKPYSTDSLVIDTNSDCISRTIDDAGFDNTETDIKSTEGNFILVVEKEDIASVHNNVDSALSMQSSDDEMVVIINEKKVRKKRDPMVYMTCSQCPIKYRFVSKLKDHMKTAHDIDLFYCKVCKIVTEQKEEYGAHLKMHRDKHQCTICNVVYKKAETLVAHMKSHEKKKESEQLENANVCEQCGVILEDEESLEEHVNSKHVKQYTCYYCGRMYRGEGSLEAHVRKHEEYWNKKRGSKPDHPNSKRGDKEADKVDKSKRAVCQTCGKDFVDERSLLWHQRLHSNDRPYKCDVCGRGFVSKNRRNQHSVCAHTPPQRRCPLCPALFHLRSMVNTHVKKVHLKAHKRRNRTSKHQNVFWRTQPVPIQELSIDVQNDVLELKAAQEDKMSEPGRQSPVRSLFT